MLNDSIADMYKGLFSKLGTVLHVSIRYDRAGRSSGVAFVMYAALSSAKTAIREFDGANANGQPIQLSLVSSAPGGARARNPFDTARKPPKSLFERVSVSSTAYDAADDEDEDDHPRLSDVSRPAPEHIDRYVPSHRRGQRSRSPVASGRRRGGDGGGGGGRRPGARREQNDRGEERRATGRDNRPRKTQEELDAEMEDYWGSKGEAAAAANGPTQAEAATGQAPTASATAGTGAGDDIDMIE